MKKKAHTIRINKNFDITPYQKNDFYKKLGTINSTHILELRMRCLEIASKHCGDAGEIINTAKQLELHLFKNLVEKI